MRADKTSFPDVSGIFSDIAPNASIQMERHLSAVLSISHCSSSTAWQHRKFMGMACQKVGQDQMQLFWKTICTFIVIHRFTTYSNLPIAGCFLKYHGSITLEIKLQKMGLTIYKLEFFCLRELPLNCWLYVRKICKILTFLPFVHLK